MENNPVANPTPNPVVNTVVIPNTPQKTPVSVGGWIGRSLIPYIPLVGGLVYLIMLFVWSGDTTKEDSFRNWAKAQLIVMAIVVGLVVVLTILIVALGVSSDIMNSIYY